MPATRPARYDENSLTAPEPRITDVQVTLQDYAQVNWDIDPEALDALLPDDFRAERFEVDGAERAMVSAVNFMDVDFRVGFAPFIRMSMGQTNYRAYVVRGDERAAWFFGTTLDSATVHLPRLTWGMPWHHADIHIDASWGDGACQGYTYAAVGEWGPAQLHVERATAPLGTLPGFLDDEDTAYILTHPLEGYFRNLRGHVANYGVWHERFVPVVGDGVTARFEAYEKLGLISQGQPPHSVIMQERIDYQIRLPPVRVRDA